MPPVGGSDYGAVEVGIDDGGVIGGVLRKTASIATLGLINFRSKNERLAKVGAERDEAVAESLMAQREKEEQSARAETAERRARRSERRANRASKKTKHDGKRSARSTGSS